MIDNQEMVEPVPPGPPDEMSDGVSPVWQREPWPLRPGQPIGQSFRVHRPGLTAIEVLVAVTPDADGEVTWVLHEGGPTGRLLYRQVLPISQLTNQRYARLAVPPLDDSAGRLYFFALTASAPGLAVYTTGEAQLADATVYRGQTAAQGGLAFRTFVIGEDARLRWQQQIDSLQAERAELTHELTVTRHRLRTLEGERLALYERLAALLERLAPTASPRGAGGA